MLTDGSEVVAVYAVTIATSAGMIWRSQRWWRNRAPAGHADRQPDWWTYGSSDRASARGWRAWVRLQGAITALLYVSCALLTASAITNGITGWRLAVMSISFFVFPLALLAAAGVWFFNRPRWLVAPHLRAQPGLFKEMRGASPIPTPAPHGVVGKPGDIGPFMGLVAVLMATALVVWGCVVALVPGLVAGLTATALAVSWVRWLHAGTRWEQWRAQSQAGPVSTAAGIVLALGAFGIALSGAPDTLRASVIATLGGCCLAWASTGLWLLVDFRRRHRREQGQRRHGTA